MKRRNLAVVLLIAASLVAGVAAIISSNTLMYQFTAREVRITRTPIAPSEILNGDTDNVTVTVSTSRTFTGYLVVSLANTTVNAQPCWTPEEGGCDDFSIYFHVKFQDRPGLTCYDNYLSARVTSSAKQVFDGTTFNYSINPEGLHDGTTYSVEVYVREGTSPSC